jgi:hypothetical protein
MIATVTHPCKTRWMIIDEAFNAATLIEFLATPSKDAGKQVFFILDNLRVRHRKPVKAWAAEHQDKFALFYLPTHRPELNPGAPKRRPQACHRDESATTPKGQTKTRRH